LPTGFLGHDIASLTTLVNEPRDTDKGRMRRLCWVAIPAQRKRSVPVAQQFAVVCGDDCAPLQFGE
jgi:hypothetical protein